MDNEEIENLCLQIKELKDHFLGVFPCDMLPKRNEINSTKFCIANLDPSYMDGSHWVALIYRPYPKKDVYFDSYGRPPPLEIERRLKKDYKRNKIQLQHSFSTACGQWCIFFCCALFSNHALKKISDFFDRQSDLLVNDYIVNNFVNSILTDDNIYKVIDRKFLKKQFAIALK